MPVLSKFINKYKKQFYIADAEFSSAVAASDLTAPTVTITANSANVRSSPVEIDNPSNRIGGLTKGQSVVVYEQVNNGWLKIRFIDEEGHTFGYIKTSVATVYNAPSMPSNLNLSFTVYLYYTLSLKLGKVQTQSLYYGFTWLKGTNKFGKIELTDFITENKDFIYRKALSKIDWQEESDSSSGTFYKPSVTRPIESGPEISVDTDKVIHEFEVDEITKGLSEAEKSRLQTILGYDITDKTRWYSSGGSSLTNPILPNNIDTLKISDPDLYNYIVDASYNLNDQVYDLFTGQLTPGAFTGMYSSEKASDIATLAGIYQGAIGYSSSGLKDSTLSTSANELAGRRQIALYSSGSINLSQLNSSLTSEVSSSLSTEVAAAKYIRGDSTAAELATAVNSSSLSSKAKSDLLLTAISRKSIADTTFSASTDLAVINSNVSGVSLSTANVEATTATLQSSTISRTQGTRITRTALTL